MTTERFAATGALVALVGILLVAGLVSLVGALHQLAPAAHRARTTVAVACAATFAAMIVSTYVIQTTLVPSLVAVS